MAIVLIILVAIIAIVVLGWLVVGLVFKLLWWALIGSVIGALARLILPGRQDPSVPRRPGQASSRPFSAASSPTPSTSAGSCSSSSVVLAIVIVAVAGGSRLAGSSRRFPSVEVDVDKKCAEAAGEGHEGQPMSTEVAARAEPEDDGGDHDRKDA